MRLLTNESRKSTKFIRIFDDGAGVYARPLTETERDSVRRKSRITPAGKDSSDAAKERRYKIGIVKLAVSDWEGIEDENGPIKYDVNRVEEFFEMNPVFMDTIFGAVHTELLHITEEEIKNSESGQKAGLSTE